jgi:Domain of unknown function (DUF222)
MPGRPVSCWPVSCWPVCSLCRPGHRARGAGPARRGGHRHPAGGRGAPGRAGSGVRPGRAGQAGPAHPRVITPEEADRLLGEALAREEARANRRHLTLRPDSTGGLRVTGRLDPQTAALLEAALEPLAKLRPADEDGPDPRTRGERQADALGELCRRFLVGLPDTNGGEPYTVVVTIPEADLRTGLGAALLPTGDAVSAGTARRMACHARIIPVVLDGEGQPLDVGRARRLFTASQRRALALRDGDGCAFPGDIPRLTHHRRDHGHRRTATSVAQPTRQRQPPRTVPSSDTILSWLPSVAGGCQGAVSDAGYGAAAAEAAGLVGQRGPG